MVREKSTHASADITKPAISVVLLCIVRPFQFDSSAGGAVPVPRRTLRRALPSEGLQHLVGLLYSVRTEPFAPGSGALRDFG
jgi:hypothetical protein